MAKKINPRYLVKGENNASLKYAQLAKYARRQGNKKEAEYLEQLSRDEKQHKHILARIYKI